MTDCNEKWEVRRAEMRAQADRDLERKMEAERKSEELTFLHKTVEEVSKRVMPELLEMYRALRRLEYLQPSADEDEEDFNITMEYGSLVRGIDDSNLSELGIVNRVLSMLVWVRRNEAAPRPLPMPTT
jgi:hypothetical protein